jgi:hypothetical protein
MRKRSRYCSVRSSETRPCPTWGRVEPSPSTGRATKKPTRGKAKGDSKQRRPKVHHPGPGAPWWPTMGGKAFVKHHMPRRGHA